MNWRQVLMMIAVLSMAAPGRVEAAEAAPAPVPKTGQINSIVTGDDATSQTGVASPSPRFSILAGNATVRDNLTGLVWARNANLGGKMTWSDAVTYCEALDHGGHTDWRLPNVRELLTLIDYGRQYPALPQGHPFQSLGVDYYWSSTTCGEAALLAWYVCLYDGFMNGVPKASSSYVLPVRGASDGTYPAPVPKTGQTTSYQAGDDGSYQAGVAWPNPRFTVQEGADSVRDNLTGLIWVRDGSLGGRKDWREAITFCGALEHGGHSDWRLPNIRELLSLFDFGREHPALSPGHPFVNVRSDYYYVSTWYELGGGQYNLAWYVCLYDGFTNGVPDESSFFVWAVRSEGSDGKEGQHHD